MASVFTHAVAGAAVAQIIMGRRPGRVEWLAAALAVLPDADVIGFQFGLSYGDMLGHRGLTHSLAFACAVAAIAAVFFHPRSFRLAACLAAAAASHGFLDALTDGGLGVAFFAPFDSTRDRKSVV